MKKIAALFHFVRIFLKEFLKANLSVAYIALFMPNDKICSSLVKYEVLDLKKYEILLMAQLITLTPGTIAIEVNLKTKVILIHILHTLDPKTVIKNIDKNIKCSLLGVTRC